MAKQFSTHSQIPPIGLLPPAADAAGRTGVYKSLRNIAGKIAVVCRVNQGNAATVQFSLLQAKDNVGTGSKVLANAIAVYYNADTTASDSLVPQTAAVNFTTDATLKDKIVVFEFDPAEMDVNNGFNHLTVSTGASNAANITAAHMQGLARYQQDAPPASEV